MQHDPVVHRQVALLHVTCLDQGFLSSLGPSVLTQLYRAIDESPSGTLHVEKRDGRVIGFVAGGRGIGPIFRQMLRHPFSLCAALAPLLFRPRKIIGIIEVLLHSRGSQSGTEQPLPAYELLSIAVAPEGRGTGVAERLYTQLVAHFRTLEGEVSAFRIVVGASLAPAHRFYLRMGARPVGRTEVHAGQDSTIYIHYLEGS